MLKPMIYFLSALLLFGCNKQAEDYIFTIGDTENMSISSFDTTIEAIYNGNDWEMETVGLDLNNDGEIDIVGESYADSIIYPPAYYQKLSIRIINEEFIFSKHPNSGLFYTPDSVYLSYSGTFPVKDRVLNYTCEVIENPWDSYRTGDVPMYAVNDQEINKSDFNWESETFNDLSLKIPVYRTVSREASPQGDSLYGEDINFPGLCENLPENEIFYLLFRNTSQGIEKYGWLELKIDGNEIWFVKSAIQE